MKTEPPAQLPILDRRAEIESAIARHQVVVLCGATGSGKTTQLPQICYEMGLAERGVIGHTQPRRLAARAVAARIAEERGARLGGLVGVKVRFEDRTGRDTRIKVMTDGTLLAELSNDLDLRAYSVIILDEAHERSLNVDFLIGYLRRLLPRRPDLKVVVTSATIDPQKFSAAFGGPERAPVIEVSGRMYPVEVRYRPASEDDGDEVDAQGVADAVGEVLRSHGGAEEPTRVPGSAEGDVLVFLPGEREIRTVDVILKREGVDADVLPLFSRLTSQEQDRIFHPGSRRRVILATNVAETSLTVPGIRFVVDSGLARISRYDAHRKVQTLPIEPISRASADQRAGRCGRVAAGVCVRLYSEESFRARPAFTEPEIRRSNLAAVLLQMKALGLGSVEEFPFLDPPEARGVQDACETLFELGATDSPESGATLTDVGRSLARLPVDPRIGRILLAARDEGAVSEVLVLAAALSIQDPRERPLARQQAADEAQRIFRHDESDFLTLLKVWDQYTHAADSRGSGSLAGWCREHFLSPTRMREWGETLRQLRSIAEDMGIAEQGSTPSSAPADAVHRSLLTGLITNVACREGAAGSFDYRSVRGGVVQVFPGSVLFKKAPKWIMAAELVQTTRLYARTVARVQPEWIEELSGHMFRRQVSDPHLDSETGEPSAFERVSIGAIVVVPRRRAALAPIDPARAHEVFVREALAAGRFTGDRAFATHNRRMLEQGAAIVAKTRRAGALADPETIASWFAERVPHEVVDPRTLDVWLNRDATAESRLMLPLEAAVRPEAMHALSLAQFPDEINLGAGPDRPVRAALAYALAPGREEDGITSTIALDDLPSVCERRAEWLVPGVLEDLVLALLKLLPKADRSAIESRDPIQGAASEIAGVLNFGVGDLRQALSEAAQVLIGITVRPESWSIAGLPVHLRLRFRIVDDHGKELGVGRDLAELRERLKGRLGRALAARHRAAFGREGITTWDFGSWPAQQPEGATGFPALIDRGDSVSLTVLPGERQAAASTALGLRRLFALAVQDEIEHYLDAFAAWKEMSRQYSGLGSAEELRRAVQALVAERVFMTSQSVVATSEAFEERIGVQRGRLAAATREVAEVVARSLEDRARIAHRLAGGTPRLWVASIADLREHAAYLMPRGCFAALPWERVRTYPKYTGAMRARLGALREEGSKAETDALAQILPRWKLFTGWVAGAMGAERASEHEAVAPAGVDRPSVKSGKAALPQTRRTGAVINVDAGEWAMRPGQLPPPVERFRWALEDARAALFGESGSTDRASVLGTLDAAWREVNPRDAAPSGRQSKRGT